MRRPSGYLRFTRSTRGLISYWSGDSCMTRLRLRNTLMSNGYESSTAAAYATTKPLPVDKHGARTEREADSDTDLATNSG